MKLFNSVKELLEGQFKKPIFTEAGNTSVDNDHWHKHAMDVSGDGKTIDTRPRGYAIDHVHQIVNGEVKPFKLEGEEPHTHVIEA